MMPETCMRCGVELEGEDIKYTMQKNFLLYTRRGDEGPLRPIVHNCKTPEFFEERTRRAKARPADVERALERLLMNPDDKAAIAMMRDWKSRKLFDVATDPKGGMLAVRASKELLRELLGDEPQSSREPIQEGEREIIMHVSEPELPRRSRYKAQVYEDPKEKAYDTRDDDADPYAEAFDYETTTAKFMPTGDRWGFKVTAKELPKKPMNPWAFWGR